MLKVGTFQTAMPTPHSNQNDMIFRPPWSSHLRQGLQAVVEKSTFRTPGLGAWRSQTYSLIAKRR